MMALAIFESLSPIHIHWFEMRNRHYAWQLPSAKYWLAQADARGLEVIIHGDSMLSPISTVYGFDWTRPPSTLTRQTTED